MTKLTENNPQGTANIADDRMLATGLIRAVINKEWNYMLSIFPEGVDNKKRMGFKSSNLSTYVELN